MNQIKYHASPSDPQNSHAPAVNPYPSQATTGLTPFTIDLLSVLELYIGGAIQYALNGILLNGMLLRFFQFIAFFALPS